MYMYVLITTTLRRRVQNNVCRDDSIGVFNKNSFILSIIDLYSIISIDVIESQEKVDT